MNAKKLKKLYFEGKKKTRLYFRRQYVVPCQEFQEYCIKRIIKGYLRRIPPEERNYPYNDDDLLEDYLWDAMD